MPQKSRPVNFWQRPIPFDFSVLIPRRSFLRGLFWAASALFTASLVLHGAIGFWSRYVADDFSLGWVAQRFGPFRAIPWWYKDWDGRYSFTFVTSVASVFSPGTTWFYTASLLALWAWALWSLLTSLVVIGGVRPWCRWPLVSALLFAICFLCPDAEQSLYWQCGLVTYALPVMLWTVWAALAARFRHSSSPAFRLGSGLFAFALAGFSECFAAAQIAFDAGALLCCVFAPAPLRRALWPLAASMLAGAVLGLVTVAHAPGNLVRETEYPPHPSLPVLLALTAKFLSHFYERYWLLWSDVLLLVFLLFALAAKPESLPKPDPVRQVLTRLLIRTALIGGFTALVIACCYLVTSYATQARPDPRVVFIPLSFLLYGTAFLGLAWGRAGQTLWGRLAPGAQRVCEPPLVIFALYLCVPFLLSVPNYLESQWEQAQSARTFAAQWQENDAFLKSQKGKSAVTVPTGLYGGWHLDTDPAFWVNDEIAHYYRFGTIRRSP